MMLIEIVDITEILEELHTVCVSSPILTDTVLATPAHAPRRPFHSTEEQVAFIAGLMIGRFYTLESDDNLVISTAMNFSEVERSEVISVASMFELEVAKVLSRLTIVGHKEIHIAGNKAILVIRN